jgi:excisionase family DNA binding protein
MQPPSPSAPPLLLRPQEAAALLGVSRAKFYRLLANGTFGNVTVQVGQSTRISRRALEAWIARQLDWCNDGDGA